MLKLFFFFFLELVEKFVPTHGRCQPTGNYISTFGQGHIGEIDLPVLGLEKHCGKRRNECGKRNRPLGTLSHSYLADKH